MQEQSFAFMEADLLSLEVDADSAIALFSMVTAVCARHLTFESQIMSQLCGTTWSQDI